MKNEIFITFKLLSESKGKKDVNMHPKSQIRS